jgi:predicted AlkP superfamily phosphohydrolase/phosphomutase
MLVIGVDAADDALIERWSDEGELPTFNFLRKEGVWVSFRHDGPMPSAAVWPSIYTGTKPGKHGIYNGLPLKLGQQAVNFIKPSDCAQPPFWRVLDEYGKHSIIVDVPFNYPLVEFGGIQVLDWGTYERHYEAHSFPGEIITEISNRFGAYPFGSEMARDAPMRWRHFKRVRSQLLAGIALKGRVIQWWVSDRPWDFLMVVFCEPHPAGHYFWNGESKSPLAGHPEFSATIKDVYKAIDEQIARIIANLGEEFTLLVLSGQGMGPNCANWHLIPEVLSRMGLLVIKGQSDHKPTNWLQEAQDWIPVSWRRSVVRYLPASLRDYLRLYRANSRIDWEQTRAFHLPTDLFGYIRINLKGREPLGIVEPGPEYNRTCSQIREALNGLVNPHTGKRIVREVFHTDQLFPGPQRERLPDLIIAWEDEPVVNGAYSEEIRRVQSKSPDLRSGNHKPDGFGIFYGHGVRKQKASEANLVDVAPTILKHFGLKAPSNLDGQSLDRIFS